MHWLSGITEQIQKMKSHDFGTFLFLKNMASCIFFSCLSCPFELRKLLLSQGDPGIDTFIQGRKGEKGGHGHQVRWSLFAWGYWYPREQMLAGGGDLGIPVGST